MNAEKPCTEILGRILWEKEVPKDVISYSCKHHFSSQRSLLRMLEAWFRKITIEKSKMESSIAINSVSHFNYFQMGEEIKKEQTPSTTDFYLV